MKDFIRIASCMAVLFGSFQLNKSGAKGSIEKVYCLILIFGGIVGFLTVELLAYLDKQKNKRESDSLENSVPSPEPALSPDAVHALQLKKDLYHRQIRIQIILLLCVVTGAVIIALLFRT